MLSPIFAALAQPHLQLFVLLHHLLFLLYQIVDAFLHSAHLGLCAGRELFDDLEYPPQTEDDHERAGFFKRAGAQDEVDYKGKYDNEGVKGVERRGEEIPV